MKVAISLIAVIFLSVLSDQTYAQFNYTDFSSTEGLKLVVNAAQFNNKLRLTPASTGRRGAAWYRTKQYIQNGFETTFQFQFNGQGGISPPGADGIAFVIQVVNDSVISASNGGSIGYSGITNSLAIEFDTWPNGEAADPNGNHISIHTRGLLANSPHHSYSLGSTTVIPNLKNQSIYTAKIMYTGTQLIVYLNDLNVPVLTVNVNLSTTLALDNGKAWVGFTSATGNAYENHDLISWSFTPVPLFNIELAAPYTDSSQFYPRAPLGLNKFLINIRVSSPVIPNPPLNNIAINATLDGSQLNLRLNSIVTLDTDNDGIIDQLPAVQKPNLNYIEFIASSNEYTSNQMNKNLNVSVTSIDGDPVNISASDMVSLYFTKEGNNVYSLTRDAYSFGNSSELTWSDQLFLYHKYGVGKGWWIYTYLNNFIKSTFGRCYGMTTTSGAYFLYPDMKPLNDTVYKWNPPPQSVSEKINLAHLYQKMSSIAPGVNESYESILSNLNIQRPTILGIIGYKIEEPVKKGGHAILALGMTTFNNQHNSFIQVYDPNKPSKSYCAKLNYLNNEFYYKSSGYLFIDTVGAFPQNSFLNWEILDYYYSQYLKELTKSLYQSVSKVFSIACPANLLVISRQGLRVGYLANNTFINEIPGAEVDRAPTNDAIGDSVTVIRVPLNDEYELVMNSFGTGNLVFEHLEPVDSTILFTAASDTVPLTNQTICHFDESDSTHLYVDIDGNGTIDSTINLTYSLLNLPLPGTINSNINQGWNLISNPVTREANTDSVRQLYPNSIYPYVFRFVPGGGYQQYTTMENGSGFWGKFPSSGINVIEGGVRDIDTIEVSTGWNLIGSLSVSIDTSTIRSIPPNIRTSNWYGFAGGYTITNQITPGSAYWVKANANGQFVLSAEEQIGKSQVASDNILDRFNSITIADGNGSTQTLYFGVDVNDKINQSFFEMPPLPPGEIFDARFRTEAGDYILQTHTNEINSAMEFPIVIQSSSYSLSISWDIKNTGVNYELSDGMGGKVFNSKYLIGQGTIQLNKIENLLLKVAGEIQLPNKFDLSQNYPNPFNPSTTIKFSVPKEVQVNLGVFNILGERVKELRNEVMKPGYYEVEFDAAELASGIYFYRIKAGDFVETKKMVLIK